MLKNDSNGVAAVPTSPVAPVASSVPIAPRWDDAAPHGVPATLCEVSGTDAVITLLFGRRPASSAGDAAGPALSHRIALTPFAAKRLAQTLARGVEDYEQRFGAIPPA